MIRAVDNKELDLSDDEYEYYKEIVKSFGTRVFQNLFETNEAGFITLVKPPMDQSLPQGVVFFLFNVMLNQRVREFDKLLEKMQQK